MEASFEVEDDVFFADLSKQISLLIMDDDEESLVHCPSVNLQAAFTQAIRPSTQATLLGQDQQSQIRREMSKGTGVFIPRSMSNARRNNVNSKQGRFNANYKYQRPNLDYHNSRGIVPHLKYDNNNVNPSTYDAINPRRFGV
ncbi:uncharacterized protein [Henckelia pumila]|uniref:uncharacterized protein n=1 Tax=Henckelia pumila TaxID=405737 RepID=UPI003C6E0E64